MTLYDAVYTMQIHWDYTLTGGDLLVIGGIVGLLSGLCLASDNYRQKSHYILIGTIIGTTWPISLPAIAFSSITKRFL